MNRRELVTCHRCGTERPAIEMATQWRDPPRHWCQPTCYMRASWGISYGRLRQMLEGGRP